MRRMPYYVWEPSQALVHPKVLSRYWAVATVCPQNILYSNAAIYELQVANKRRHSLGLAAIYDVLSDIAGTGGTGSLSCTRLSPTSSRAFGE